MFLSFHTGDSLSTKVHQAPSSIITSPDVSPLINCNHSISLYDTILWYQRPVGDSALKLIGFIQYTRRTMEDKFKDHFNITGDGSTKAQLHVLKPRQPQDSGMYYCAASRHSDSIIFSPLQKPSLIFQHINSQSTTTHLHLTTAQSRKSPQIFTLKPSLPAPTHTAQHCTRHHDTSHFKSCCLFT